MKIKSIRILKGVNIHCYKPVVMAEIDLEDKVYLATKDIEGFNSRLLELIPSLQKHKCSLGKEGGFVERLNRGTYLPHVIEHISLELQTMLGLKVSYGKARSTDHPTVDEVIVELEEENLGEELIRQAFSIVNDLIRNEPNDLAKYLNPLERILDYYRPGPSTMAILEAAHRKRIPIISLNGGSLYQLGYGKYRKRISAAMTEVTSSVAVDVACCKDETKAILSEVGIPVPKGIMIRSLEEAQEVFKNLPKPLVMKPSQGNQGKGVTMGIYSLAELEKAWELATRFGKAILLEEQIIGHDYRGLVIDGRVVAVAQRLSPMVIGDGVHNIQELVTKINRNPLRGEGHEKPLTKVALDQTTLIALQKQGYSLEDIPSRGIEVVLRENSNLSTGGEALDVTDEVHPSFIEIMERAARIMGLDIAGIDIIAQDIKKPYECGQAAIIEVNAAPGLRMHLYPSKGKRREVGEAIVNWLFPDATRGRIPIVAVTGSNGKSTTTRLIGHVFQQSGSKVGITTSEGIFIDGKKALEGDTTGPWSAEVILKDPLIEVAVLETARGGILRDGLAFDECDVAVITNITGDHLGQDGIKTIGEMAGVKSLIGEVVPKTGHLVLNADDEEVVKLVPRFRGKIIYFSMEENSPIVKKHLSEGGKAIWVEDGFIFYGQASQAQMLLGIREIPITYQGSASHMVQNVLASLGAALALNVEVEALIKGLRSFGNSIEDNPGRFSVFWVGQRKIVVDYGHNAQGFFASLETLKKLEPERRILAVATMPGDRRDEDIIAAGRVLANFCHKVIIKEDQDLRGRQAGQIAMLLKSGVSLGGLHDRDIDIILSEKEAIWKAFYEYPEHDVIIFYEKYAGVMQEVEAYLEQGHPVIFGQEVSTAIRSII